MRCGRLHLFHAGMLQFWRAKRQRLHGAACGNAGLSPASLCVFCLQRGLCRGFASHLLAICFHAELLIDNTSCDII